MEPMSPALRVCIDVDDLEKAIAFCRDALGLTLGRRLGGHWAEMLGAPVSVDLLGERAGHLSRQATVDSGQVISTPAWCARIKSAQPGPVDS